MKSDKKITSVKQRQPKNTDFYRLFEEQFRGSRELIVSRLQVYLPFVEPLKRIDTVPIALDLGCGRGEWLELLKGNGFKAKGVDLDEGMLLACYERKLDVHQGDALAYLRGLEADSLSVVSAFHVVEHIAFETLRELTTEAYRVLKPGGLLILETPNSENLMVGTSSFYLDPTHQKPLPAQLLSFVVEFAGFDRVKTLYLQDSPELASTQQTSLANVLGGVSPDYAIVAQKKTSQVMAELFNAPFEHCYGLRLDALADRYDQQTLSHSQWLQSEWDAAKQRIEELSKNSGQLEANSQWLQKEWEASKLSNEQLQTHSQWLQKEWEASQTHSQWLQNEWDAANTKINELEQERKNLYASSSWRITKPLRLLSFLAKKIIYYLLLIPLAIFYVVKLPFKLMLSGFISYIYKRPRLKTKLVNQLKKYPRLQVHLRQFANVRGVAISEPSEPNDHEENVAQILIKANAPHLSSRARRIYDDLKADLEQQQKEYS